MSYQHSVAEIVDSQKQAKVLQTTISLHCAPASPIAPASLWKRDVEQAKVLDLHALVHREGSIMTFVTYDIEVEPLTIGSKYSFISWWRPDQLEIAQDATRSWHKESFVPKDMVLFKTEAGQIGRTVGEGETITQDQFVKAGWDHEHCFLCWETISTADGEPNEGYTDGKEWLCETCYETYIASGFGKRLGEQDIDERPTSRCT